MREKKVFLKKLVPLVVFCIVLTSFIGCQKKSEQDAIKRIITNVQKAVEEKDIRTIFNSISKAYKDPQGNTYNDIKNLVLGYFYRYPKISVYLPNLEVMVEDVSAQAVFEAVLTGKNSNDSPFAILPESLGIYAFEVLLKKESGDWKIVSAKWERMGDAVKKVEP